MAEMKYSGIKWIGDIPKEWSMSKYKYFSESRMGETILSEETVEQGIPVYSATESNDIFGFVSSSKLILRKNDFVIPARGNSVGFITIVPDDKATCTQTTICSRNIHDINYKYLYYSGVAYKNDWFRYDGSAIPQITVSQINNNKLVIPSIKEQKLIADFLDEKVDIIDKIIGDLNNQIEILNKYKKQIITETVTSGLNKNAKFKDSGIDWMGEIPEHWEIKRLKYLGSARNGLTYEPEDQCDEGMLVLRSSNIQDGKLCLDDTVYVNMKVPKNIILKRNDLLICSRNGSRNLIGKNILIEDSIEGNTYGAFMCVFRSKYNKYIHYVLNSNIFDHYLNTFLTSTINQLTNSNLYSIKIAIPMDIEEQQEIVKYLDDRCQKIDEILNSKIKQKKQMEQYKKSVIYEYVTGKKRVEGAEELYG